MMSLPVNEKKLIVENRMQNIAREAYNLDLTIKMYEAYNEKREIIDLAVANHAKQLQAYAVLEEELATLNTLSPVTE